MWRASILSAFFAFILEMPIDKALADWAKATNANGSSLLLVVINAISFLAIFSVLFTVFNKVFGRRSNN